MKSNRAKKSDDRFLGASYYRIEPNGKTELWLGYADRPPEYAITDDLIHVLETIRNGPRLPVYYYNNDSYYTIRGETIPDLEASIETLDDPMPRICDVAGAGYLAVEYFGGYALLLGSKSAPPIIVAEYEADDLERLLRQLCVMRRDQPIYYDCSEISLERIEGQHAAELMTAMRAVEAREKEKRARVPKPELVD